MSLADGLWGRLSSEILEHVLVFLPVPDLCRYRVVCKKWNRLICDRQFAARCIQNTKDSDASFIVVRHYTFIGTPSDAERSDAERGVSIFDVKAKRWYTMRRDDDSRRVHEYAVPTADGGLTCEFDCLLDQLVVYNPIGHSQDCIPSTVLQTLSTIGASYLLMAIAVDTTTQNYKIFLNEKLAEPLQAPSMLVYDSSTRIWVAPSKPPQQVYRNLRATSWLCSLAYRDNLYILTELEFSKYRLLRYSFSQNTWEDEGLEFHDRVLCQPQLIGSGNRIYLQAWSRVLTCSGWRLEVSEILISERTHVAIFHMASEFATKVFAAEWTDRDSASSGGPSLNAFVCGNLVILMSQLSGVSVQYDMATRSWDLLPRNPIQPRSRAFALHAYQTNLMLPTA